MLLPHDTNVRVKLNTRAMAKATAKTMANAKANAKASREDTDGGERSVFCDQ